MIDKSRGISQVQEKSLGLIESIGNIIPVVTSSKEQFASMVPNLNKALDDFNIAKDGIEVSPENFLTKKESLEIAIKLHENDVAKLRYNAKKSYRK